MKHIHQFEVKFKDLALRIASGMAFKELEPEDGMLVWAFRLKRERNAFAQRMNSACIEQTPVRKILVSGLRVHLEACIRTYKKLIETSGSQIEKQDWECDLAEVRVALNFAIQEEER